MTEYAHYEGRDFPPWTPPMFINFGRLMSALDNPVAAARIDRLAELSNGSGELTDHDDAVALGLTNASDAGTVVDLTADTSWLDGLDPTPAELEALDEAVIGTYLEGDGDDDLPSFGSIHDQLGANAARDAQRQDEDFTDDVERRLGLTPQSADARLARALDRVARGTYVPATPGYDPDAGFSASICGAPDALGGCSSAYHAQGCDAAIATAAATGNADEIQAWRSALQRHTGPATRQAAGLEQPRAVRDTSSYRILAQSLGLTGEGQDADARSRQVAIANANNAVLGGWRP